MGPWRALPVALLAWGATVEPAWAQAPAASVAAEAAPVDVDGWLGRLTSADAAARKGAVAALDSVTPAMLPGVAKRLAELKKSADRPAMEAALTRLRKGSGPPDLFDRALAAPSPGEAGWRDVTSVVGLSRM